MSFDVACTWPSCAAKAWGRRPAAPARRGCAVDRRRQHDCQRLRVQRSEPAMQRPVLVRAAHLQRPGLVSHASLGYGLPLPPRFGGVLSRHLPDPCCAILEGQHVMAMSDSARRECVRYGMGGGGVLMLAPHIVILERDIVREEDCLNAIAMALLQYMPEVTYFEESVLSMNVRAKCKFSKKGNAAYSASPDESVLTCFVDKSRRTLGHREGPQSAPAE